MATYGDIKTRIIAETTRDDLADDYAANLTRAINDAILFYAPQRFWFNENEATVATTAGVQTVTVPTGFEWIDDIIVLIGAGYRLKKDSLVQIELMTLVGNRGQPARYARYAPSGVDTIKLWPVPSAVWNLQFIGTKDEPALSAASDTNAWTLYADDLIAAHAKKLLCRDLFRDMDKFNTAQAAEAEALTRLRAATGRRVATGRMKAVFP